MDVLQDLLADYTGTVILISHDRDFVDRVVDRVIVRAAMGVGSSMPVAIRPAGECPALDASS